MDKQDKLHQLFFSYPMRKFGVRELSRITHLNSKTVMKYLRRMVRKGIAVRIKQKNSYPYYEANRLLKKYKLAKSTSLLEKLASSGIIDYLEQKLKPKAIVLFGSAQKGTYLKTSDVDIFIQAKETKIDLQSYEQKLKHEIQLFFEENMSNLTTGLRNNIINGNTLSGALIL
ncbi:MAG: nucleotidyltransferase domain-containing protein [Candidatus Aenigmarchaeota archaeon]|nr:nucleotidyltransferase domain-containing protein [Candidatus Aenigmarchaeota archaeon]